jgi:hypothetical protein
LLFFELLAIEHEGRMIRQRAWTHSHCEEQDGDKLLWNNKRIPMIETLFNDETCLSYGGHSPHHERKAD